MLSTVIAPILLIQYMFYIKCTLVSIYPHLRAFWCLCLCSCVSICGGVVAYFMWPACSDVGFFWEPSALPDWISEQRADTAIILVRHHGNGIICTCVSNSRCRTTIFLPTKLWQPLSSLLLSGKNAFKHTGKTTADVILACTLCPANSLSQQKLVAMDISIVDKQVLLVSTSASSPS